MKYIFITSQSKIYVTKNIKNYRDYLKIRKTLFKL